MKAFLTKLFLGENVCKETIKESAITRRVKNLKIIWNGDDYGLERLFRLFLALSQFIFIGTYVRQIFGRKSSIHRDISIDVLVVFKIIFSVAILKLGLASNLIFMGVLLWFFFETLLYIPTLIFASDYLTRPRSYKRSMLLFFLNYLQISIDFGCMYSATPILNKPFDHWYDAIYFSFITGSTTGYGDYYPVTTLGKYLVTSETVIFMIFIVLFFNVFSNKMEIKGYFDTNKQTNLNDNHDANT